jgi:TetR/AcrR family transcriptional repressor of lmrAB and yxaGH operons
MDTKDKMIEATITLMRRAGFSAAGINEIVKESGTPKGSIYHFFPEGKRQIVSESLTVYTQRVLAVYDEALSSAVRPGEKIQALFRVVTQRLKRSNYRQSCAAGAVCLDLDEDLEGVRLAIAGAFSDWITLISKHFKIRDPIRRRSFAGLVLTTIEGGYIRGRAERSGKPFTEAAAWLADIAEREVPGTA